MDFRPYLRAEDHVERAVELAVGRQVAEWRARDAEIERKNLATEVGSTVGGIVSRSMQNLARAMRG